VSLLDLTTGDTRAGRDLYEETAARWAALHAWWSRDPRHFGLDHLQAQFDEWTGLDRGVESTTLDALRTARETLDLAEEYAHEKGYPIPRSHGAPVDWSALEDRGAAGARALESGGANVARQVGDAVDRAKDALADKAGEKARDALKALIPPWWVIAGGGAVFLGLGFVIYQVAKAGSKVARYLGPVVAPEAMPLWLAMQRAQGAQAAPGLSAPSPASYPPAPGPVGLDQFLYGTPQIAPPPSSSEAVTARRSADAIATRLEGLAEAARAFGVAVPSTSSQPTRIR
jgi:hypothetical protein